MKNEQKMIKDDEISFMEFYNYLQDKEIGNFDGINSEDVIKQYCSEMMIKGIHISHIIKAIEDNPSTEELYCIWLGNSMETPTPINNKQDLYEALEIGEKK